MATLNQSRLNRDADRSAPRATATGRNDIEVAAPAALALRRLANLIARYAPHDGVFPLRLPGTYALRRGRLTSEPVHATQGPALCIVAQGAKVVMLGREVLEYDAARMLVFAVDLPISGQVTRASARDPFLGFKLDLDPARVAELAARVYPRGIPKPSETRGLYVGQATDSIIDAVTRLLDLMARVEDADLLGPLVVDEILIRLLRTSIGTRVAQIGRPRSGLQKIAEAVSWIREHFAQPVTVQEMAASVHTSASSFHQRFKAVTSMSPLQYQKTLRLHEARRLMLFQRMDASEACSRVGYLSPSQFSREYGRFFGVPRPRISPGCVTRGSGLDPSSRRGLPSANERSHVATIECGARPQGNGVMTMRFSKAVLLFTLASPAAWSQVNVGEQKPEATLPFEMTTVSNFSLPWRIAFLPDGRMLVTEKIGPIWLVSAAGEKIAPLAGTPAVYWQGQNGMLGVYVSPRYATDQSLYITYIEPGDYGGGQALARAKLDTGRVPRLQNFEVLWRQMPRGKGGQAGGQIAFSSDGQYLFMSVGDRQRMTPAQDANQPVGKILRLTLDGKPAPGNPNFDKTGAATIPLIDPPRDTEVAKTAPVISSYTFPGPNQTPAETWASGVRAPYGLAFSPTGELWEVEHGPRGGDELNLIEKGKNYGWPVVSYGMNYNQVPIPRHDTQPEFAKPVLYWAPVIAPGNLMFYRGTKSFPQWDGSGFVSGLATQSLTRITFDGKGGAKTAERWAVGKRIRDVAQAPDGTLWLLEDANPGALIHVTPK